MAKPNSPTDFNNRMPTFDEFMLPMLKFHGDSAEHALDEIRQALIAHFNPSPAILAVMLPSGQQTQFMNRLGWAKTHLVKALLLTSSEWSKFQITQRGKELLGTNPEALKVKEMKAMYPEFKEFMENKKKTKQQKIKSPANLIVPVPTDDGLATAYFGSKAVRMSPSDLAKVLACMS